MNYIWKQECQKRWKEIQEKFKAATKNQTTPGFPNKVLKKNQGEIESLDDYWSIVWK
jgi:hypothetical protein